MNTCNSLSESQSVSSVAQSCLCGSLRPHRLHYTRFPVHHQTQSLWKLINIKLVMPSNHLILCRSLLLLSPSPPSIRFFSNESTFRMRWPKYWRSSLSIIPSKEIPGLISFRMDWLDLLAVQETLKSLFQHHSWKASVLWHSAFFMVQLSHPYLTNGQTTALTIQTFVCKVMSLLFICCLGLS